MKFTKLKVCKVESFKHPRTASLQLLVFHYPNRSMETLQQD